MSDQLNFFTALLGLMSSILVFRGNRNQSICTISKNDPFKDLKRTFNTVGSISLIFILYFGFMVLIFCFPRLIELAMNIGGKKGTTTTDEIVREYDYSQLNSNNQIAFRAAQLINSYDERETQYSTIILRAMNNEENDLVVSILRSFNSVKNKEINLDKAFEHYINNRNYIYALRVAEEYSSIKKKDFALQSLIEKMYTQESKKENDIGFENKNEVEVTNEEIDKKIEQ